MQRSATGGGDATAVLVSPSVITMVPVGSTAATAFRRSVADPPPTRVTGRGSSKDGEPILRRSKGPAPIRATQP